MPAITAAKLYAAIRCAVTLKPSASMRRALSRTPWSASPNDDRET